MKPAVKDEKLPSVARTNGARVFCVLDVEAVRPADAQCGSRTFVLNRRPKIITCDLLVAGGGLGGVATALAAHRSGIKNICLIEETSWPGGQLTAQAVSAPDENYFIEGSGGTRTYKELRNWIRDYYRSRGGKDGGARFEPWLDPGNCWVSRLAFEPAVALEGLRKMLQPLEESRGLRTFLRYRAVAVKIERRRIRSLLCVNLDTGCFLEFRCKFCVDATELGDLLPLGAVPYRSGAESREQTGEEHAPAVAEPDNVQDYTYPFIVEFCSGENHTIEKPPHYDTFKASGKFSLKNYKMFETARIRNASGHEVELLPFWEYRRLIAKDNFPVETFPRDIAMINWESNDMRGENIIDKPPELAAMRLAKAKCLSLGFLYWLQTEAPRDEGGFGYPELRLRPDLAGTEDGLAKYPYIRESRRIMAKRVVVEQDITCKRNPLARARLFPDSIGIGHYPVDIHAEQSLPAAEQMTRPFQIPAASLVQQSVRNLLPACKNIGTTHITNGAYRLHPIEWAIGEAAGTIASECLKRRLDPWRLVDNKRLLRTVQKNLVESGCPLYWFSDLPPDHEAFAAVQYLAVCGLLPHDCNTLTFQPDAPITRAQAAASLCRLLRLRNPDTPEQESAYQADGSLALCMANGLLCSPSDQHNSQATLSALDLVKISAHRSISLKTTIPACQTVSRSQFAVWLFQLVCHKKFFGRH